MWDSLGCVREGRKWGGVRDIKVCDNRLNYLPGSGREPAAGIDGRSRRPLKVKKGLQYA